MRFFDGNLIVGSSNRKNCVGLLFWTGQSLEEDGLKQEGSFQTAEVRYTDIDQIQNRGFTTLAEKTRAYSVGI